MDGLTRRRARADSCNAGDSVIFGVESLNEHVIPKELMRAHYAETAPMKDIHKMAPDWDNYREMQDLDQLIFVTARTQQAPPCAPVVYDIVGYMVVVIRPHLHYRKTKVAIDDLHYLAPEYRGAGWGKKMIAFAEQKAKEAGAKVFSMRCKAESNHGYIFESLGYKLTDLVYLKDLTDA